MSSLNEDCSRCALLSTSATNICKLIASFMLPQAYFLLIVTRVCMPRIWKRNQPVAHPSSKTLVLSVLCCSFYSALYHFHFIAFSPQMQNAPLLVITICTLKGVWHQRPRWYLIHSKRLVYKIVGSIMLYIFAAIWHKIHFSLHASRPQLCKKITNFQLYKIFFIK